MIKFVSYLVTVLVLGSALAVRAQTEASTSAEIGERVAVAERFVYALYPELADRHLMTSVVFTAPTRAILIRNSDTPRMTVRLIRINQCGYSSVGIPKYCDERLLETTFGFRKNAHLPSTFNAYNDTATTLEHGFIRIEDWKQLRLDINKHPEWTDAQILTELKRRGGNYGVEQKDKARTQIVLALERAFGPIEVTGFEFKIAERHSRGDALSSDLYWLISFKRKEEPPSYTAMAEPFEVKIVSTYIQETVVDAK
jgi:hypothetical protein